MPKSRRRVAVLDRLLELTVLMSDDMERGLADMGLTTSRVRVVWEVARSGPSTQRALADALGVAPRTITGLVDSLVETGFVLRRDHPADRRATLVALTAKGRRVGVRLVQGRADMADELLSGLGERRLAELGRSLDMVLARLRGELGRGAAARGA